MLKWIPELADLIATRPVTNDIPLYKAAAKITKGFLEEDRCFLAELLA